ncbi:MAG: EcsC family protein [Bacteroidetes bacterium]|nr:EcsC family protein [Bacteroidota bacterium]
MEPYERLILKELNTWKKTMEKKPSIVDKATKGVQSRINKIIPEKIHKIFTEAVKQMTRTVILGAKFTTTRSQNSDSLEIIETGIKERIKFYRSAAAAEGAVTGFGGFLTGLADFPLWLSIKMKMLFEIASRYGFDVKDYKERIYILHIFQLTFSSQQHRNHVFSIMVDWENKKYKLPEDIHKLDWRTFQLEYRDYIDLVKLFQLIPGIGAAVGLIVNHRLTDKLGKYAINAYRMRVLLRK